MQLNIRTKVVFLKRPSWELISCSRQTIVIAEVLERTFTGLVADGTVQRVIDQQHLHNAVACVDDLLARDILYDHAVHDIGTTAGYQLGHRSWVGSRARRHFHQTGPALTATAFQLGIITHRGRRHISTNLPGRSQDTGTRFYLYRDVVDRYLE